MTKASSGAYFFSTSKRTNPRSLDFVPEQPEKETFAISLAKAHLETELTDYIIMGFDRRKEPLELTEYYNVGSAETLDRLRKLASTNKPNN